METLIKEDKPLPNNKDEIYIRALKTGDNLLCGEFFDKEIGSILHKIRIEMFRGQVDFYEMVNELYLFLSTDNWSRLDSFESKNGCRLRTWMIPVAWRFFINMKARLMSHDNNNKEEDIKNNPAGCDEDLRIQMAIDVLATFDKMPNRRYAEILRLFFIEGYRLEEIAEMLGTNVNNIYNLKHRAVVQFIRFYGK